MNSTKSILDRISNLISDDSKILEDFNKKIETSNTNKAKAEEEKKNFEEEITHVQNDIDDITKASEVSDRFSDLEAYMPGLEKVGKSVSLLNSLKEELDKIPEQIENLENKIKELTDESDNRSKVIKESEDELAKLDVDISDAKRYQENLIELIDLSKSGDINKTREEVVETLTHVGFTEKEAVAAAKVILFPEDDLIPYFERAAAKKEVVEETPVVEEVKEEQVEEENVTVDETPEENVSLEEITEEEIALEPEGEEIVLDSVEDEVKLDPVDVVSSQDTSDIRSTIESLGFDQTRFNDEDLDNTEVVKENLTLLSDKDINKEFIYSYPSIISDSNLKDKYDFIINTLNKTEEDIKLSPSILVSYTYDDLDKLVQVSKQTGIDPTLIPLSVFLKGLQSFFRNYIVLKENNITLENQDIAKFAAILAINPVDFKKSLQMLMDYKVSVKKNDGKVALSLLAINSVELANKMDMIINTGEEDLIKYYPECLATNVKELVDRILFLKKSEIPYKTVSHNKVVYQAFVLKQEVLDKVLEKKIELNEVLDKDETNNYVKELIQEDELFEELDKLEENFEMISNSFMEEHKNVLKSMKNKYKETDNSYVVGKYSFSKNKVNRIINYLLAIFNNISNDKILLTALLYDSRLSKEDMDNVAKTLNIK
ncbi:MAG: hypothetical protein E7159_05745 [Firmicutes bacterium]|jgi:predicted  nucleic acid-binding Zn-ribbon protein|nr:hypothetical protein [Bacillota bacterium]